MIRARAIVVASVIVVLAGCQSGPTDEKRDASNAGPPGASAGADTQANLSTLTPYKEPSTSKLDVPEGFEPVFAQNLARHGSRTPTSGDQIEDAIDLWDEAKQQDALTPAGRRFGPAARALYNAMDEVGFGELTTLGKEEMQGIGVREGERLADVFGRALQDGAKVDLIDSGRSRTEESAENFAAGLASIHPDLDIEPPESDEKLLKFDNEDKAYEEFLDGDDWKPDYYDVRKRARIDDVSIDTLERLYTPDFVATIDEPLAEANAVFDVYRSGPAMSRDIAVDTSPFMDAKSSEAFAYVDDGRYFYSRGPGVEGDDRSYRAAGILLDDFFEVIDDRLEGRGSHPHAAVYRFAHAEEMTPFVSLLELPGSDEQGKPGETYTHENNDFRVEDAAALSSNVAWTVWTKGDTTLVSVSQNERPTTVGRGCEPYEGTKTFYELAELRDCLGATE